MGPNRNPDLFRLAEPTIQVVSEELIRSEKAETILADLSAEFEERPVVAPLSEPTLLAKLHALSALTYDTMGVTGFNPKSKTVCLV